MNSINMIILYVALSYLIGSISGSLILGKIWKVDIRTLGSRNAGGTNALRSVGILFGLLTFIIDLTKDELFQRLGGKLDESQQKKSTANKNLELTLQMADEDEDGYTDFEEDEDLPMPVASRCDQIPTEKDLPKCRYFCEFCRKQFFLFSEPNVEGNFS